MACIDSNMEMPLTARGNVETDQAYCIICLEEGESSIETNNNTTAVVLTCGHEACRNCIKSWIERCEQNGLDEATCPHCRQVVDRVIIQNILGRSYARASKIDMVDELGEEFTQTWLNNNRECTNCGMWILREPEEADENRATACICGYIYCWTCDCSAEDCECGHSEFYDMATDMHIPMEHASRFPMAGLILYAYDSSSSNSDTNERVDNNNASTSRENNNTMVERDLAIETRQQADALPPQPL